MDSNGIKGTIGFKQDLWEDPTPKHFYVPHQYPPASRSRSYCVDPRTGFVWITTNLYQPPVPPFDPQPDSGRLTSSRPEIKL